MTGKLVFLRKLREEDLNENYLGWINDPEVLKYRENKSYPSSMAQLRAFYDALQLKTDVHLAICTKKDNKHVGNLSLDCLQWSHHRAALNIMVGDKSVWGKGVGTEAIALLTRHAFMNMGLHHVWAESPNPGFNAVVKKLGWTQEGIKRESFFCDGSYIDMECHSILRPEWDKLSPKQRAEA